jgi:hypothetical protein
MYAALVRLTIDPAHAPTASSAFTQTILPRVRSSEGFVTSYWLDPADGEGFGFVLFETEDQALRATPPMTPWPAPGIKALNVDLRRVAAAVGPS